LNLVLNKAFFIDITGSEIAFKVNDSLSKDELRRRLQEETGEEEEPAGES
jgi:hypothetical protein